MPLNEEAIRFLEEQIPEMADSAVKQAYSGNISSRI